jgi:hypothetical protein
MREAIQKKLPWEQGKNKKILKRQTQKPNNVIKL